MPGVPPFRACPRDAGRGEHINDRAFANVVAAEHDDVAWAASVEHQAGDAVAYQRINQQRITLEPICTLIAAEQCPGKRSGIGIGQKPRRLICVVDGIQIRDNRPEQRLHLPWSPARLGRTVYTVSPARDENDLLNASRPQILFEGERESALVCAFVAFGHST